MARVYLTSASQPLVYTNDQAVGNGCQNKRDDVLLVQFFLKVNSEGRQGSQFTPAGSAPIRTDGIWGPASQAFLNQFLANADQTNFSIKQDGRVDPVVGGRFTGPRAGNLFTIVALNVAFANERGPDALKDITNDPLFPQELMPSLKIIQG